MLRLTVLLLILLNCVYFGWSQGFFQAIDFAPAQQREPQRLAQQIMPEALRLVTEEEVTQAATEAAPRSVAKPGVCLQAGGFDEAQAALLRSTLESAWPAGVWLLEPTVQPAHWIVYMGQYPSAAAMEKKRAELLALKLEAVPLSTPPLAWGLSLGGFETPETANAGLAAVGRRGVRTARVLQDRAEVRSVVLRLPAADEALRARLDELKPLLAGKSLSACQ